MLTILTFYISLFALTAFIAAKVYTHERGLSLYPARLKSIVRRGDKVIHKTKRNVEEYKDVELIEIFQSITLYLHEKLVELYQRFVDRDVPSSRLSARRIVGTIRGERKLTHRTPSSEFLYDMAEHKRGNREE